MQVVQNISVLLSTYQSFNKATNSINKNKIEQISYWSFSRSYIRYAGHLRL